MNNTGKADWDDFFDESYYKKAIMKRTLTQISHRAFCCDCGSNNTQIIEVLKIK